MCDQIGADAPVLPPGHSAFGYCSGQPSRARRVSCARARPEPGCWCRLPHGRTDAPCHCAIATVRQYTHALQYQAVFEAFRDESYFSGAFWWNWNTDDGHFAPGTDDCLTPQNKPAEDVLRLYYRATAPKPPPSETAATCIGAGKCTC